MEPQSQKATRPREERREKLCFMKVKDKILPGVRITLLISLIFYVAMFVIGIWGIGKCPVNENIPFFLIVTGAFGLMSKTLTIIGETILKKYKAKYAQPSFYTVELVFLLLGSYWVFTAYKPSFSEEDGHNYCNKTVYMFAFIYLATIYAIIIAIVLFCCCCVACLCYFEENKENNDNAEAETQPMREPNQENIP